MNSVTDSEIEKLISLTDAWLDSEEGKKAFKDAYEESEEYVYLFRKAREITPELLNMRITI